jgi:hypothetical protein
MIRVIFRAAFDAPFPRLPSLPVVNDRRSPELSKPNWESAWIAPRSSDKLHDRAPLPRLRPFRPQCLPANRIAHSLWQRLGNNHFGGSSPCLPDLFLSARSLAYRGKFLSELQARPSTKEKLSLSRVVMRALFRTRTGDPLLTMEVLYQLS